jgi:hypothetical protein
MLRFKQAPHQSGINCDLRAFLGPNPGFRKASTLGAKISYPFGVKAVITGNAKRKELPTASRQPPTIESRNWPR